jgi:hypothetical protein
MGSTDMRRFCILFIVGVVFFLFPYSAHACSIPVFRYALERWPADYYEGIVIHKGPLADDNPAAKLLQGEKMEFLNLRVSPVDQASPETDDLSSLLAGPVPETLPVLVLWYPSCKGRATPFWTGPFTVDAVKALIQSPKRQELARRLIAGQTAVWIFVESGNAGKDKTAMQLINQELDKATKELKEKPPELGLATDTEELQTTELAQSGVEGISYKFSILPVSRSDPNEKIFLDMLLKSEPDLDEYSHEPIVFPTFGRGRALFALVGEGINSDNLRDAIAFITGPCGCEIKMMNPGVDLLMNENWDAAAMQSYQEFYEMAEEPLPELTGVFPEESNTAGLNTQGKVVAAAITEPPKLPSALTRKTAVEGVEGVPPSDRGQDARDTGHGLGVMGTAAVSLAAILIAVGLGTLAVTKRKKTD